MRRRKLRIGLPAASGKARFLHRVSFPNVIRWDELAFGFLPCRGGSAKFFFTFLRSLHGAVDDIPDELSRIRHSLCCGVDGNTESKLRRVVTQNPDGLRRLPAPGHWGIMQSNMLAP